MFKAPFSFNGRIIINSVVVVGLMLLNGCSDFQSNGNPNDNQQSDTLQQSQSISTPPTIFQKISIDQIQTGFDPYNPDNLWLPTVAIEFKNNSDEDIKESAKVTAIFVDKIKGEQMATDFEYLSSDFGSDIFLGGTKKQITLKSTVGWYAVQSQNVIAKIYLNDSLIKTVKINNQEFNGRIQ